VSIDGLARRAGLDPTLVDGIEHGRARPTVGALLRIAKALDVPVMDLIEDSGRTRKRTEPRQIESEIKRLGQSVVTLPDEVGDKLHAVEMAAVTHAVALAGGNLSAASRVLGLERKALIRRWEQVRREVKKRAPGGRTK
jgi:transcriptional regulator with XRE-family HTH domain